MGRPPCHSTPGRQVLLRRHLRTFALHARVHGLRTQLGALLGWCTLSMAATGVVFILPQAEGFITLPFRNFVPAGAAVTVVGFSMLPPNHAFPLVTARLARVRHGTLVISIATTAAAIYLAAWAGSHSIVTGLQCGRAVVIWSGLATVSTALWGRSMGWVLPLVSIAAILFWGHGPDRAPRCFNWSDAHASEPGAWSMMMAVLAIGVLATWLTNWRCYAVCNRRTLKAPPLSGRVGVEQPTGGSLDGESAGRVAAP